MPFRNFTAILLQLGLTEKERDMTFLIFKILELQTGSIFFLHLFIIHTQQRYFKMGAGLVPGSKECIVERFVCLCSHKLTLGFIRSYRDSG